MGKEIYEYVRDSIRSQRRACNLTQEQLAEKVGVDTQTISRIERKVNTTPLETLYNISNALNCPISSLLPKNNVKIDDSIDKLLAYKLSLCTDEQKKFISEFIDLFLSIQNKD